MIYPLLMKNYACHRLYDSPDHYSGQSVVTLDECGQVVAYVPLTNELPATEWIGGVILLSDKQELVHTDTLTNQFRQLLSGVSPRKYAWHISAFDFQREEPISGCIIRRL